MFPAPALSRPLSLFVLGLVLIAFLILGQGAVVDKVSATPNKANKAEAASSSNGDGVGLASYSSLIAWCAYAVSCHNSIQRT